MGTIKVAKEEDCWDKNKLYNESIEEASCSFVWDNLHCWARTPAGGRVEESCADLFPQVQMIKEFPKEAFAFRECDDSGKWSQGNWTNYSLCHDSIDGFGDDDSRILVEVVRYVTFIGASLSLLLLSVTLFVFAYFRSLECDRLRVHRNLICALLIRFLVSLIFTEPFVFKRTQGTYRDVGWICKSLIGVQMYAQMASINWMFVEGLFLHSRLTSRVFDTKPPFRLYYSIGWGLPLVFISIWAYCMTLKNFMPCWEEYASQPLVWILVTPMIVALTINLLFLINIIRILVTKLRASQALEATQVRKALRAALILFPLLGIPNLLFAFNPRDNAWLEGAYMLCNATLHSAQGIFVAILHCFCTAEVKELFQKRWRRLRAPTDVARRRKSTKSTIVPPPSLTVKIHRNNACNYLKEHVPEIQISVV